MSKLKIVGSLIDKVAGRVDDFTLDKQEKAELLQEINKAQLEVNKIEAGQTGLLVRWRPFLGWVLSFAFGYHYLIKQFLNFIFAANGNTVDLPTFDMNTMTTVLFGMLGMAGMRSFEKVKGRA